MAAPCNHCHPDEVVCLVRAGDRLALGRITRCYGAHLLAVGRRVCGDDERARDAVQDALLSAGQHLDQFRHDGTVEGWLVRMVCNAVARPPPPARPPGRHPRRLGRRHALILRGAALARRGGRASGWDEAEWTG